MDSQINKEDLQLVCHRYSKFRRGRPLLTPQWGNLLERNLMSFYSRAERHPAMYSGGGKFVDTWCSCSYCANNQQFILLPPLWPLCHKSSIHNKMSSSDVSKLFEIAQKILSRILDDNKPDFFSFFFLLTCIVFHTTVESPELGWIGI